MAAQISSTNHRTEERSHEKGGTKKNTQKERCVAYVVGVTRCDMTAEQVMDQL